MRDIVATIQPEQDELVRAELERVHLRPGRTRHREDSGRAAPGRLPALRAPGAAAAVRRARGRPQPRLPALHLGRAAGARRGRRRAGDRRGAAGRHDPRASTSRRWPRSSTSRGWPTVLRERGVRRGSAGRTRPWSSADGSYRWRVDQHALRRIVDDVRRGATAVRDRPGAGTRPDRRAAAAPGRGRAGELQRESGCARWARAAKPAGRSRVAGRQGRRGPGRAAQPTPTSWRPPPTASSPRTSRRPSPGRPPRKAKSARGPRPTPVLLDEAAGLIERGPTLRPRRRRRGAGPLPDAVPRDRPAQRARLDHRCSATWPRAPTPWAARDWRDTLRTSASRRPGGPADHRVPGAGRRGGRLANRLLPRARRRRAADGLVPPRRAADDRARRRPHRRRCVAAVRAALELRGLDRRDRRGPPHRGLWPTRSRPAGIESVRRTATAG